jgi:glycerol kinase
MLMNLSTLDWDDELLAELDLPRAMLPEILPSAHVYGEGNGSAGALAGVPVAGALGDQQAALFGQTCFAPGEAKCTYGTGSFLLLNTGDQPVVSERGLVTTVGYQVGDGRPAYALEGSIAVTGALVQWLRDNLGIISAAPEINDLAAMVSDNGGCYVVPAFSGLFAPYWRSDARGVIAGLTGYVTKSHLARAALEATAWQVKDVADAMNAESTVDIAMLKADGGMTASEILMQFQADVLGVPVVRPVVTETTCLGAAYAAGLAVGYWPDLDTLRAQWHADRTWKPTMPAAERDRAHGQWRKAVQRSLDWVD